MIKKLLILFFLVAFSITTGITTSLWMDAYEGTQILQTMSKQNFCLHIGVGCISLAIGICAAVQIFKIVGQSHEEELEEIRRLR